MLRLSFVAPHIKIKIQPATTSPAVFQTGLLCLVVLVMGLLAGGCRFAPSRTPITPSVDIAYTAAAATLEFQLTMRAGETAVAQLTHMLEKPTATPLPPTIPPSLTPTHPTATPLPPTAPPPSATPTVTPVLCDMVQLVGDVTVPNDTTMPVSMGFEKTWRIRNIGSCTWTPAYSLVFVGGDPMGSITAVYLPGDVQPGQTIDLSIRLSAPAVPGTYQGDWSLQNPSGDRLGGGGDHTAPLIVRVHAIQPTGSNDHAYDLAFSYCSGNWFSETGALACPGAVFDPNGSVILLGKPHLEARWEDQPALWVRPNQQQNGRISGQFPAYTVQTGDRFRTEIGCLVDSPGCDITFHLDFQNLSGPSGNLGSWREVSDGLTTVLDIDLSWLAGEAVVFILSVTHNGAAWDANGFWLAPRVENFALRTLQVLAWTQEGHPEFECAELRVYMTGETYAEAQAVDCSQNLRELGWLRLDDEDFSQILTWVRSLRDFDAEIYRAAPTQPLVSWIDFKGSGEGDASDGDIQTINTFAGGIFTRIAGK